MGNLTHRPTRPPRHATRTQLNTDDRPASQALTAIKIAKARYWPTITVRGEVPGVANSIVKNTRPSRFVTTKAANPPLTRLNMLTWVYHRTSTSRSASYPEETIAKTLSELPW